MNDPSPHRGNTAEPCTPGAAGKPEKKRFRIILQMMGRCNACAGKLIRRTLQKLVTQYTCGFLQADMTGTCKKPHIPTPDDAFDSPLAAPGVDKGFVPIRFFTADAMVKVRCCDGNSELFPMFKKNMRHADGIRPAGECAQHLAAGTEQVMLPDKLNNLLHGFLHRKQTKYTPRAS